MRTCTTLVFALFLFGQVVSAHSAELVDALFIYKNARGKADAKVWQEVLRDYQLNCHLLSKSEVRAEHLAGMKIVIIGAGTPDKPTEESGTPWFNYWGDQSLVDLLAESSLPILGISSGGLTLFGQMELPLGGGHFAHGTASEYSFAENSQPYLTSPFVVEAISPISLSTTEQYSDGYHLPPSYIERIVQNHEQPSYFPVVRFGRFVVWGVGRDAGFLTVSGRRLFANVAHALAVAKSEAKVEQ